MQTLSLGAKKRLKNRVTIERCNRVLARRHLVQFGHRIYSWFESPRHIQYLADIVEKAERKEKGYNRLIISLPPQHGKSTLVSRILPTWWLGRNPDDAIIEISYGQDLSLIFSQDARDIIRSEEYAILFPGVSLSPDSKAKNKWNVNRPNRGSMTAAGILGGVTGRGADLMIVDDPIKNREQAESKTYRDKVIREYKATLSTRLHKDSVIIVMMTRWHQEDLAGWLIEESGENWKVINLPALAEKDDLLGRRRLGALWPSHFPQSMLVGKKRMMGAYDWYSMYQGHPRPPEGNMLKRKHFQIIDNVPENLTWVRFWDLAITVGKESDYTCSLRACFDSRGNLYLDKMIRGRYEWGDVREKISVTSRDEGRATLVGVESNAAQKGMCQELWRDPELASIGILPIHQHVDKRVRALPLATRGEIGKLYLVKGAWNEEFIEECIDFPNGAHDDQVDAASGCMGMLSGYYGFEELTRTENKGEENGTENEPKETDNERRTRKYKEKLQRERERERVGNNAAIFVG